MSKSKAIRVTRKSGLQNILGAGSEKILMTQVLNKVDRDIDKVERGFMSYAKNSQGEIIKEFEAAETIYQSKSNMDSELANKSLALAMESQEQLELEKKNSEGLQQQIDELKKQLAKAATKDATKK